MTSIRARMRSSSPTLASTDSAGASDSMRTMHAGSCFHDRVPRVRSMPHLQQEPSHRFAAPSTDPQDTHGQHVTRLDTGMPDAKPPNQSPNANQRYSF